MRTISALLLSSIALVAAGAASAAFAAVDTTPPTPVAPPAATANVLAFSPVTLDMGAMTAGQPKTLDLTITNTSGSPVTIESIKGGCGCTTVTDPPKGPIEPGASFTVQVTMDPGMKTGIALRKPVHVALTGGRVESMNIVATVKTVIKVTPEVVETLGKAGSSVPTVVLASVDGAPFRITGVTPSGAVDSAMGRDPSGSHEIAINLDAWTKAGRPATIVVSTDRPDAPSVAIPVTSAEAVSMFRLPAAPEDSARKAALESAQDSLIRDIDAGLSGSARSTQFRMRLHRATGMLFVHGSDSDIDAVRKAVSALPATSGVRESSPTPGI
jgi:hypothetical protein